MDSAGTTNPLPADAVTIPATARGAFHLPPAVGKAVGGLSISTYPDTGTDKRMRPGPSAGRATMFPNVSRTVTEPDTYAPMTRSDADSAARTA